MLNRSIHIILALVLFCGIQLIAAPAVQAQEAPPVFVDGDNGDDANDGLTWATAKKTIAAGIDAQTNSLQTTPNQVWVKTGIYNERIRVKPGVLVRGGFKGDEQFFMSGGPYVPYYTPRNLIANPTIIDGSNNSDFTSVVMLDAGSWNGIEGMIVTGGSATGASGDAAHGGGVLFRGNSRFGIYSCIIAGNEATQGGGLYLEQNPEPIGGNQYGIRSTLIVGNSAESGGGVYAFDFIPELRGNTIAFNEATVAGSGLALDTADLPVRNTIFAGNIGAAAVEEVTTGDAPVFSNCLFSNPVGNYYDADSATTADTAVAIDGLGNSGTVVGDPLFMMDGPGAIMGSWTADASYDSVTNRTVLTATGAGLPEGLLFGQLIFPDTTDAANGAKVLVVAENTADTVTVIGDASYAATGDGFKVADLRLQSGSAALDAGDNTYIIPEDTLTMGPEKDIYGSFRSAAYNTTTTLVADIGAHEMQRTYYVDMSLTSATAGDGSSWATALDTMQPALDGHIGPRWIFVKEGSYFLPEAVGSESVEQFASLSGSDDDGVWIFGGFAGDENHYHFRQGTRTVLDGNAPNNGIHRHQGIKMKESQHLWIDGFRFQQFRMHGGSAGFDSTEYRTGAGLYIQHHWSDYMKWTAVTNCTFTDNHGWSGGGGLYVKDAAAHIYDCDFHGNWTDWNNIGKGGGMRAENCRLIVQGCEFTGNHAGGVGGGLAIETFNWDYPSIIANCVISGNMLTHGGRDAGRRGGGLYYQANNRADAPLTLVNSLITGNRSDGEGAGVAILHRYYDISGCTISGNESWHTNTGLRSNGDQVYLALNAGGGNLGAAEATVANSIIEGPSSSTLVYCGDADTVPEFHNNLFYNSLVGGDVLRLDDGGGDAFYNDATALNGLAGSLGNAIGDPMFAMFGDGAEGGTWTASQELFFAGVPDPIQTRFWDANANWIPGELVGRNIILNVDDHRMEGYVRENATSSVMVQFKFNASTDWGLPEDANGKNYVFADYTPEYGSPAIDALTTSLLASSPDVYGNVLPADMAGVTGGGAFDLGAIEFNPTGFFTLDKAALTFAERSVQAGASSPQSITVSAVGDDDATITNVTITGAGAGDFNVAASPSTVVNNTTDAIDVTFDPSSGGVTTATLVIESTNSVNPVISIPLSGTGNAAPIFASDPFDGGSVAEDSAYSGDISGDASDADDIAADLSFSKVGGSYSGGGTDWLVVNADGTLGGTPTSDDNAGLTSWTIRVEDPFGGFDTTTLEITVTVVNDPPALADPVVMPAARINRVYAEDLDDSSDIVDEEGATLSYAKLGYTGPAGGSDWLSIGSDGALTGTPVTADLGLTTWTLEVGDGNSSSTTQLVINVTDANSAPVFRLATTVKPVAPVGEAYSETLVVGVSANPSVDVVDADGDTVTFSVVSPTSGTWLSVSPSGALTGTPTAGDLGTNQWVIRASDGEETADGTLVIEVRSDAAVSPQHWTLY